MHLPEIKDPVVYLCPEFAIDNDLPTYAGGLGVLAGDLINAAASEHFPMIGIGILYKGQEYEQHVNAQGQEEKRDSEFDHDTSFLRPTTVDGKPLKFDLVCPSGCVKVKAYHIRLSDTTIQFFLSTNIDGNPPEWRADMNKLYGGDENSQIRQQILLGVGGARLIKALGINPKLYHLNEGRAGFAIWELAADLMKEKKISFKNAWKAAREKIVYTNHTLVAAGNPTYDKSSVEWWAKPFAEEMGVNVQKLIEPGVKHDRFSITDFALNISKKQSAVSQVHGKYAKEQYPDYEWLAITNGVHLPRWQDSDFRNADISDKELWDQHLLKKKELQDTVVKRTGIGYDYNRLVISWARRLAGYKQPRAIFEDAQRLRKIVSNSERPVQILYAGNSHSADPHSKSIIEDLIRIFSTELRGHAIFVPNYNISLANHMTSGSDIWLNTPKGNLEASGTSGMKAVSNGVLNFTVLDGWTYEVDWKEAGWTLDPNNLAQDFYDKLENDITPMFYDRDEEGVPKKWLDRMRRSISIADDYSAVRMLKDYEKLLYSE